MIQDVANAKILATLIGLLKKQRVELTKELKEESINLFESLEIPAPLKGDTGERGEQGPQGAKGEKGDSVSASELAEQLRTLKGDKGDTGDIGPQGDKGDTGDKGDKGDKGDTGARGFRGYEGLQGVIGPEGQKGNQGEKGPQGIQGVRGENGVKGDDGLRGAVGPTGEKGSQGERGQQGSVGLQGVKGSTGQTGDKGDQGEKGDTGDTPSLEPIVDQFGKLKEDLSKRLDNRMSRIAASAGSSSGGGEVRLEFLDDVDRATAKVNNKFLQYNAASGKWKGADATSSGSVSNTYIQASVLSNTNIAIANLNTNLTGTNTAVRTLINDRMQVANTTLLVNDRAQVANVASLAALANTNASIATKFASANLVATASTSENTETQAGVQFSDRLLVNPAGYITVNIGGTEYKVPYFS